MESQEELWGFPNVKSQKDFTGYGMHNIAGVVKDMGIFMALERFQERELK